MADFILSCCSTADLTKDHFESRNIKYVCFHFEIDGKQYPDDLGESFPFPDFYKKMEEGAMTKTSQVNAEEFIDYFEPYLKEGKDILHLCLSSGISGVYNSACIAQSELQEKYPDRKIYVVDSLCASSGLGLLMDDLADMRDAGKDIDQIYEWVKENLKYVQHWFFTSDLTYLVRGGRVSKVAGAIGSVLNICPILNVNSEGKLITRAKVRTKKKAMAEMVERMKARARKGVDYDGKCYISQSACYDDARALADMIEAAFPKLNGKVLINDIGTTIGSHTGPGLIALFFWGDEREL